MRIRFVAILRALALPAGLGAYLLTHDIPTVLGQADKSAEQILGAFGVQNPNDHLATYIWQHPRAVILVVIVLLAASEILLWGLEAAVKSLLRRKGVTPQSTAKETNKEERRRQISILRDAAVAYGNGHDYAFRGHLEGVREYADIRKYLAPKFIDQLHQPRTVWAMPPGARYGHLVEIFLDELDRLEKDWVL
jgi:hypothetical protein